MPVARTAFIFPAFTSDLSPGQDKGFPELEKWQAFYLAAASRVENLTGYNPYQTVQTGEYSRQCTTYIQSCAAAAALREKGIIPSVAAGYSMGIYAAIHEAGCIGFETGLKLILDAYRSLEPITTGQEYGMMVIIGLSQADILMLTGSHRLRAEITNQNSDHAFVISGTAGALSLLRDVAHDEGALHVRMMETNIPYHSGFLEAHARQFGEAVKKTDIAMPRLPVISLVDQSILSDQQAIRKELVRNLYHPLNWQLTLQALLGQGVNMITECGPPTGLARNSKFIKGEFRFFTLAEAAATNPERF